MVDARLAIRLDTADISSQDRCFLAFSFWTLYWIWSTLVTPLSLAAPCPYPEVASMPIASGLNPKPMTTVLLTPTYALRLARSRGKMPSILRSSLRRTDHCCGGRRIDSLGGFSVQTSGELGLSIMQGLQKLVRGDLPIPNKLVRCEARSIAGSHPSGNKLSCQPG